MTLYESIAVSDYPLFERLLAEGHAVNEVYLYDDATSNLQMDADNAGTRSTPAVMAAIVCTSDGDDRFLRRLAEAGADLDAPDPEGHTPLDEGQGCSSYPDVTVRTLAELGADLYRADAGGQTALDKAIRSRYALTAVALVESGFDPARSRRYRGDPGARRWLEVAAQAEYAVRRDDPERLAAALDRGASPVEDPRDPLLTVAVFERNPRVVRLLLERGADPNVFNHWEQTPLILACQFGDLGMARDLVAFGADVNLVGQGGGTPLSNASAHSDADAAAVVQFLLEAGADPHGRTAGLGVQRTGV